MVSAAGSFDLPSTGTVLTQAKTENFPVATRLLPRQLRRHLLALYGYARLVDEVGDESTGDRLALLDAIATDLDRVYQPGGEPRIPLVRALAPTVRECAIPRPPLDRLLEANRRDQRVRRYQTFAELRDYCTYSADPVGELVLYVFGLAGSERIALSNHICTALQVLEHCQDVAEDLAADRVYLPVEDLHRCGASERDLALPFTTPAVRQAIRLQVDRATALLDQGRPLIASLPGLARATVSGYLAGGCATAAALAAADYDVLGRTVRARRWALVVEWARLTATGGRR